MVDVHQYIAESCERCNSKHSYFDCMGVNLDFFFSDILEVLNADLVTI